MSSFSSCISKSLAWSVLDMMLAFYTDITYRVRLGLSTFKECHSLFRNVTVEGERQLRIVVQNNIVSIAPINIVNIHVNKGNGVFTLCTNNLCALWKKRSILGWHIYGHRQVTPFKHWARYEQTRHGMYLTNYGVNLKYQKYQLFLFTASFLPLAFSIRG